LWSEAIAMAADDAEMLRAVDGNAATNLL